MLALAAKVDGSRSKMGGCMVRRCTPGDVRWMHTQHTVLAAEDKVEKFAQRLRTFKALRLRGNSNARFNALKWRAQSPTEIRAGRLPVAITLAKL